MIARTSLIGAGAGLILGAMLHVAVLAGGPGWIAFVGAPETVVRSARAGTWLAPATTLGIAALLGVWALYALSAAGRRWRPPFAGPVLWTLAALFVLRGLLFFPMLIHANFAAAFDPFHVVASLAVLVIGFLLAIGARGLRGRA